MTILGALRFSANALYGETVMNLYEELISYQESGIYPMHMPGHKRNPDFQMVNPYGIDVTEVEGTDDLHHPAGMIRGLMDHMRQFYHTKESYLLVNGSTCGILAAVSACACRGGTIIMARNSHRSVYHAAYLLDLKPVYLYPKVDEETGIALGIQAGQVADVLRDHPEASCVVVTSPTYEGVVSDIREIAGQVHEKGIPLIVDEAHGAHFAWGHPFWKAIPEAAISQGADLVVESLHKTLPALTQTGVLHLCSDRISLEKVGRYLDIYESSSPSYVLMAGAAMCMEWMRENARTAFSSFRNNWLEFCGQAVKWNVLSLWENPEKEPSKLVVRSGSLTGYELALALREKYHIQVEMEGAEFILAMTSICDTDEGWQKLASALTELDRELGVSADAGERCMGADSGAQEEKKACARQKGIIFPVRIHMSSYEAMNCPSDRIRLEDSLGWTAAEYAFVYPPGIPFLVPGEEITDEVLEQIQRAKEKRLNLMGLEDEAGEFIRVCEKRS